MNAAGLFAYGTLKQHESNHWRVEQYVRAVIRDCYIWGQLYDAGEYPAMVTPGLQRIRGELLIAECLDELLRATDEIEGTEYERVLVDVHQESYTGAARQAWAYRFAGDASRLRGLTEGEWSGAARIFNTAASEEP